MRIQRITSPWFAALLLLLCDTSVRAQEASPDVVADLTGPTWQLVKFEGGDEKTLTPDEKKKYTLAFGADGGVSVRIDCNRGRSTWKSGGRNHLELGALALTRMRCPPALLDDRLPKDWPYVRSYIIKDGHLFLSLMADAGIYEFEPSASHQAVTDTPNVEGAAAQPSASAPRVKGTVSYRERMVLPPGAILEITLEDVSKADAPADVIGKTRIETPGNPPIPFEITYDTSRIDPSHRYVVRARILIEKPFFTSHQHHPVLTGGHGNEVELMLRRVGASSAASGDAVSPRTTPSPALEDTYWKLIRLGDTPVTAASVQREPHVVLDSETRRVGGSGGCNQFSGGYELQGDSLTFGQMAATMMACLEGMETEKAFMSALTQVNRWTITGQRLDLHDAAGKVVASFEAATRSTGESISPPPTQSE